MLAKIAERRERLGQLEGKLATLDRARQAIEEQQHELQAIRRRQEAKGELVLKTQKALDGSAEGQMVLGEEGGAGGAGAGGGFVGPSQKEKKQAAQLMQSTETLMKFGFMSMSMTYFSSLNMIRAMRTVAAQDTVMAALHTNASLQASPAAIG